MHGWQTALKETSEHQLPVDPGDNRVHLENIYLRTDLSIGFPCLFQNDSLTSMVTHGTFKLLLEIMHVVNPMISLTEKDWGFCGRQCRQF